MIDNPLPNQIMEQKDAEARSHIDQEHCYKKLKEICEEHLSPQRSYQEFQCILSRLLFRPQKENTAEVW